MPHICHIAVLPPLKKEEVFSFEGQDSMATVRHAVLFSA